MDFKSNRVRSEIPQIISYNCARLCETTSETNAMGLSLACQEWQTRYKKKIPHAKLIYKWVTFLNSFNRIYSAVRLVSITARTHKEVKNIEILSEINMLRRY